MGLEEQDWAALFWGCISAVSFPLGASIGIAVHIPTKLLVALMSFGAGALLFALSIELFGRAMLEMTEGKIGKAEVFCSMISGVLGALSFIAMNRFLGGHEVPDTGEAGDTGEHHGEEPTGAVHIPLQDVSDEQDEGLTLGAPAVPVNEQPGRLSWTEGSARKHTRQRQEQGPGRIDTDEESCLHSTLDEHCTDRSL